MEDERPGGESSRASSSFVKSGDRQMFTVELRPGETTIVSWKKLVKDANKVNGSSASASVAVPASEFPANLHPRLESRIAPLKQAGDEAKDEPPTNRLNAVIQKIECLYTKDSSDEDLGDVPDDDQYDTEDSFIDDAELDEYFQVDNSAIKHDGFFVNRGKLERIEPAALPDEQPKKKRSRKDFAKGNGEKDDDHSLNKQRKSETKDIDKHKAGVISSKDPNKKSKVLPQSFDSSHQKHHEKSTQAQPRLQSSRPVGADELESSLRVKEKNGIRERTDANTFEGKFSSPTMKSSQMHRRDGSSLRPKSSMLDKSIRELERVVAESRPPADNLDGDNSAQAIKRRLPREVKMKLGKVARLAANHGKVTKELLSRLMSILGHIIQLRTLKRNLKVMINMSLSDKQEQDDRFQYIKKEVVDMIKIQAPSLEVKANQQAGTSDKIQETVTEEKDASKKKFSMDALLEDKICDLYDLYVDGLDEDAGPQIRKLYAELAQLWPNGFMDNHGIKQAICRAKERRRALHRNKAQYSRDRLAVESSGQSPSNKPVSATSSAAQMPSPLNAPSFDKPKQDRSKGSSGNSTDDAIVKKKVKRKPETESDEGRVRPEKLTSQQVEERPNKPTKPSTLINGVPSIDQLVKLT